MTYLKSYIERHNQWNAIFNGKTFDLKKLTYNDIHDIYNMLEGDLSPENLCCDGELRGKALADKAKRLQGAWKELQALDKLMVDKQLKYATI